MNNCTTYQFYIPVDMSKSNLIFQHYVFRQVQWKLLLLQTDYETTFYTAFAQTSSSQLLTWSPFHETSYHSFYVQSVIFSGSRFIKNRKSFCSNTELEGLSQYNNFHCIPSLNCCVLEWKLKTYMYAMRIFKVKMTGNNIFV